MDNVLTLVSKPDVVLSQDLIDEAIDAITDLGGKIEDKTWLASNRALDFTFTGAQTGLVETSIRLLLAGIDTDVHVQPLENRRKKLLVADMDSTIVKGETLDDLAAIVGIGTKIAAITARAMNGEMDFEEALHARISMLEGVHVSLLQETADALKLNPGAETLVRTMSAHGAYTALVSGGFRFFTQKVADQIGFDFNHGNQLEIIDDHLTGKVIKPIVTKDVKVETLNRLAQEQSISTADAVTIGDGANDLPMLQAAGLGVAYHAKPVVIDKARARIEHGDLTTLLFYQGYREQDFVRT